MGVFRLHIFLGLTVILAGCSTMQAPENGSGVYYQPGSDQSPKASATEKQKDKSGPSATSSTADQPKQPQAVNPDSRYRSSEAKTADQEDQEYEYYPEDASSRSAYSDESNYRDYKYTNRIRRFESDWNRPYFDQPYNRRFSGYSSYGNRAYYDNPGGLSLRVTSTSAGFFNDPYYSGFGPYGSRFNPFYGYRQGFNDGFYSSRYRTYSPYGTFGYNRFQPGYHTPVGFYSNNNQSADGDGNKTMNRRRNPMGSNYDTDKGSDQDNRRKGSKKVSPSQRTKQAEDNGRNQKQYDYYKPEQDKNNRSDQTKRRRRERSDNRDRINRDNNNRFDRSSSPSRRQRNDPNSRNFNRQKRSAQPDRSPNNNRNRQRSPNRGNRNRGGGNGNSDNSMNRPRR